jgi:hypothetical protein
VSRSATSQRLGLVVHELVCARGVCVSCVWRCVEGPRLVCACVTEPASQEMLGSNVPNCQTEKVNQPSSSSTIHRDGDAMTYNPPNVMDVNTIWLERLIGMGTQ